MLPFLDVLGPSLVSEHCLVDELVDAVVACQRACVFLDHGWKWSLMGGEGGRGGGSVP